MTRVGRRAFLKVVGGAVGAAALGRTARPARAEAPRGRAVVERPGNAGPAVQALFGPLRPGRRLGPYTIVAVFDLHLGAIPVLLRHGRGRPFQVDVLKRGEIAGVAQTPGLALYLANGAQGSGGTDETQGIGVMALAAALGRRERAGAPVPSLLTLDERAARHPRGTFDVTLA